MEKQSARIMSRIVEREFTGILEKMDSSVEVENVKSFLESDDCKKLRYSNSPEVLLAIHLMEEQLEIIGHMRILVEDLMRLDWEKETAELEYLSMKRCFYKLHKRIEEIMIIGNVK